MQEIVQLLHASFDEDGDYICSKFSSSWMLEFILGNRCVKHRVVGTVLLFVPLRDCVTNDEPSYEQVSSATCPCNCLSPESALHLPSLLCQVWLLQPFADPRFFLGLIFQNTGSQQPPIREFSWDTNLYWNFYVCFPELSQKQNEREQRGKKEMKRKEGGWEGGREGDILSISQPTRATS